MAQQARSNGVNLASVPGPWRASQHRIRRPGRSSLTVIPVVTNEHAAIVVDTPERAEDVAGLLNWCGVQDLNPIPDLTPPPQSI
jgi:hypothetical protein